MLQAAWRYVVSATIHAEPGGQQQNFGPQHLWRRSWRGATFENPCVGGSILPRATKNIPHETLAITGWRFCLLNSQSSCPVHVRYSKQFATAALSFLLYQRSFHSQTAVSYNF